MKEKKSLSVPNLNLKTVNFIQPYRIRFINTLALDFGKVYEMGVTSRSVVVRPLKKIKWSYLKLEEFWKLIY